MIFEKGMFFYPASLMADVSDDYDLNHSIKMFTIRPEAHPDFQMPQAVEVLFDSCAEGNEKTASWAQD
jgi:hypothetical protein